MCALSTRNYLYYGFSTDCGLPKQREHSGCVQRVSALRFTNSGTMMELCTNGRTRVGHQLRSINLCRAQFRTVVCGFRCWIAFYDVRARKRASETGTWRRDTLVHMTPVIINRVTFRNLCNRFSWPNDEFVLFAENQQQQPNNWPGVVSCN